MKHQVVKPHQWIMIPILACDSKREAVKLEKMLIRRWKPSLNSKEKPYWNLKDTYCKQARQRRRTLRKASPPWQKVTGGVNKAFRPLFSTYSVGSKRFHDLATVLHKYNNKDAVVYVKKGNMDVTNWKNVIRAYGDSRTAVTIEGQTSIFTLQHWKKQDAREYDNFYFHIAPVKNTDEISTDHLNKILIDARKFMTYLQNADEEELAFIWRVRNNLNKEAPYKLRSMLWDELEFRYNELKRKPITMRLPYFHQLDINKVKTEILQMIRSMPWPTFVQEWHCKNIRIVTESARHISEILCNVTHPWRTHQGCQCRPVMRRLEQAGYNIAQHLIEGHLFLIGSDLAKQGNKVLATTASNVPQQTYWDMKRAWGYAYKAIPYLCKETEWTELLQRCVTGVVTPKKGFATSKEVYMDKKLLEGLTIGPLDKNNGELWMCCPHLYDKALKKAYTNGYEEVKPLRFKRITKSNAHEYAAEMVSNTEKKDKGSEEDILKLWKQIYTEKGWNKFASLNKRGGFNKPYVLIKHKKVQDVCSRSQEWSKTRPISPGTNHPMRKLLHLAGRAWSFIQASWIASISS